MAEKLRLKKQLEEMENSFLKKRRHSLRRKSNSGVSIYSKQYDEFGLRWLLKKCGICPHSYYNFLKDRKRKHQEHKEHVLERITLIYHKYGGIPVHRQMRFFLKKENICISKTTVYKYMNRELQLFSIVRRKRPGYRKGTSHEIFPNLLQRNFTAEKPNRVWCTDFTYLSLANGMLRYNCTIIDLFDRSVVASVR